MYCVLTRGKFKGSHEGTPLSIYNGVWTSWISSATEDDFTKTWTISLDITSLITNEDTFDKIRADRL